VAWMCQKACVCGGGVAWVCRDSMGVCGVCGMVVYGWMDGCISLREREREREREYVCVFVCV